jgi:predicted transcriptional regulator
MSDDTTNSVRIKKSMVKRLEAAGSRARRSKSALVAEAIGEYLKTQDSQVEAIKRGIAAADRGEIVLHEKVKKWAASLGAKRNSRRRALRHWLS